VGRSEIASFARDHGFALPVFETSARTGQGCEELKQAIISAIDWENIGWRTSPRLFKRLKEEIVRLKDNGRVLMRVNELRQVLLLRLAGDGMEFTQEQFEAALGLLASSGVV
jgi:Fe2+ transport system protein B